MGSQATLQAKKASIPLCFSWPRRGNSKVEQHSEVLCCDALPGIKWQMHLRLMGNRMFTFQLEVLKGCSFSPMVVNGQLSVKDLSNSPMYYYSNFTVPLNSTLSDKSRFLQVDNWLNIDQPPFSSTTACMYTIQCDLTVSFAADSLVQLPWHRFSQFALSGFLSDVAIVVQDKTFAAHKLVLAASSPVFRAMFSTDLQESLCNRVQIDDCSPKAFEAFLHYLYSDAVDDSVLSQAEMAANLFVLANKYQVDSLKSRCSSWLRNNLSVTNVLSVANLSDLHCQSDLLEACVRCIAKNVPQLSKSGEWDSFVQMHPQLITRVLAAMHGSTNFNSATWKD